MDTSPMPRSASVMFLIRPTVAAILNFSSQPTSLCPSFSSYVSYMQCSTKIELFHHLLLLLHATPMWLSRPRNWTRLKQFWVLLVYSVESFWGTPPPVKKQRTHIAHTPSHYLSVYAKVAPHTLTTAAYMHTPFPQTPANWPDRPAADIIHLPAREEGPLCRLSSPFFQQAVSW